MVGRIGHVGSLARGYHGWDVLIVLKLILTPLLVAGASLGGRRWGPTIGGWLVSLPLTSGPVAFFLAVGHSPAFAASAASASVAGTVAICAFSVAYARAARRLDWPGALVLAAISWVVAGLIVEASLGAPLALLVIAAVASTALAIRLMPEGTHRPSPTPPPAWDLPLRMAVSTAVVVGVTAIAPVVGPGASGLLAMLPIMAAVLTIFAHVGDGPAAASGVLRGLLAGLVGTVAFLAVLGAALVPLGIVPAFGLALAAMTVLQAVAFRFLRRSRHAEGRGELLDLTPGSLGPV